MACCICNKAGHDEELHGEEGQEILELREQLSRLRIAAEEVVRQHRNPRQIKLPDHDYAINVLRRALETQAPSADTKETKR